MTEQLPDKSYDTRDIERSLESLPPDMQQMVRDGLLQAKKEREINRQELRLKLSIVDFAIALHINTVDVENQSPYVSGPSWWNSMWEDAEEIVRTANKNPSVTLPESVRKAVAFVYADCKQQLEFAEREELDEYLVPFGYPTEKILDHFPADSREAVKEMIEENPAAFELSSELPGIERHMREELIGLGFTLPELLSDNSYGYDEKNGENRPYATEDMLPK